MTHTQKKRLSIGKVRIGLVLLEDQNEKNPDDPVPFFEQQFHDFLNEIEPCQVTVFRRSDVRTYRRDTQWGMFYLNSAFDGIVVSGGTGDPVDRAKELRYFMDALYNKMASIPVLGVCLAYQLMLIKRCGETVMKGRFTTCQKYFSAHIPTQKGLEIGLVRGSLYMAHQYFISHIQRVLADAHIIPVYQLSNGENDCVAFVCKKGLFLQAHPERPKQCVLAATSKTRLPSSYDGVVMSIQGWFRQMVVKPSDIR